MEKPVIAIPMGDPAGIGPEIIIKALSNDKIYSFCRPLVIGNINVLRLIEKIIKSNVEFTEIGRPSLGKYEAGRIDLISIDDTAINSVEYGMVQATAGKAAFDYIGKSVKLAESGEVTAIATAPINKEALKAAGIEFIGHTEILAGLTKTDDPLTMFQVNNLRVFFLSRHVSLRKACDLVTKERLLYTIKRCLKALDQLGVEKKSLVVAGLNPHNGEHGLFGSEEVLEISPAVKEARNDGLDVAGPVPADSVFYQALTGKYGAVLSLYHDQGHIAVKTLDFEKTVSLTLGMPFLRTSVDHGTAFDIAGKGVASPVSMIEAVRLAAEYGKIYKTNQ